MKDEENAFSDVDELATSLRKRERWWILWLSSWRSTSAEKPKLPEEPDTPPIQAVNAEGIIEQIDIDTGKDAGEIRKDRDGSSDEKEESINCGPDGTAWFMVELGLWMNFAWGLNNLALVWGRAAYRRRPWREFFIPQRVYTKSYQYAVLAIVARQLTYAPTTTFASAAGLCPQNCNNTLTLCQGCIDRSELGNFLYGVIARYLQMTWLQTWLGGIAGNRGRRTASDAAAVELGFDFINGGNTNANVLCAFFAANAVNWAKMQLDGHGCPPCGQSIIPAAAPHVTLPALNTLAPNTAITITLPPNVTGQP